MHLPWGIRTGEKVLLDSHSRRPRFQERTPSRHLAVVQVLHGGTTVLEDVWKFGVELENDWQGATVTFSVLHRIVSVVD